MHGAKTEGALNTATESVSAIPLLGGIMGLTSAIYRLMHKPPKPAAVAASVFQPGV